MQEEIARDTLIGLSANPKYLLPKYFYDDRGSQIFQNIMKMNEYYLTECEREIFTHQKEKIANAIYTENRVIDLIEFGCGDGFKTKILLEYMAAQGMSFNFIPIDISSLALQNLVRNLKNVIPEIAIQPKEGDYFQMTEEISRTSSNRKVILFLGSNIGNYAPDITDGFIEKIRHLTKAGDKFLIGFDLIKSPDIIYRAYSDPHGHTKAFNLNHLKRLNKELGANFDVSCFEHYTEYSPATGAVKSYLVSTRRQEIQIKYLQTKFIFSEWEPIFMELSQKYTVDMIENLAHRHKFEIIGHFKDHRNYFADSLWQKAQ